LADYDVVVVGSGAGGLSAALTVAQSGRSCLLLEAMPSFGGYLSPFQRKGYAFDTGLHYVSTLTEGRGLWKALETLGIREAIEFVELDPDGFERFVFPDFEFALCKGHGRFKERLIAQFPREERGIVRFFDVMHKIQAAMADADALSRGPLGILRYVLKHPLMLKYSRIPYQALLDEVTSDVRLQAVLAGQSGTYSLPPARASVLIALAVMDHFLAGASYPRGGSGALRDALVDALRANGAEMSARARVTRIARRGSQFLVRTARAEYTARAVISDADPTMTLGELVDAQLVPAKMRKRVRRLRPSLGAFYVCVGTSLDLPSAGMTNANIHQYEGYDVNRAYASLAAATLQERVPYCLITSPSTKDPQGGHAPEGHHTVEVVVAARYSDFERWADRPPMKRGTEYEALKSRIGRQIILTAERHIPGLSEHLDVVVTATPLSSAYWVNAVRGAMYGPEETPDQMGLGRFTSFASGVDGLYLAGSGTIGAGVAACLSSGIGAARKAIAYLELASR
jgi:phytoene dehydrogenase-like protein